jgi:hypothetical protein
MVVFPQYGGCLCGDVRYRLDEDPVTLYACHCTDCQRQSGSSFALTRVVRSEALEVVRGRPEERSVTLPDGRVKSARLCGRCATRLLFPSRVAGLSGIEPGTLDDTSWLRPAGHIWARSAQPWVVIPEGALRFEQQPSDEGMMALVRAWKSRRAEGP